ncbi:MAG: hypothetical protein FWC79_07715 [Oscillospiraceae bacterium]|nr:hypothetical protein [Oscillospiraceae bacterium]
MVHGGGGFIAVAGANNTFSMTGGTIRDNEANYGGGGGILVQSASSSINISGDGTKNIINNRSRDGAGISSTRRRYQY